MSNFSRSCKECNKTFDTIQSCLAHVMMSHVKISESYQRKRKRNQKLKIVETDYYKQLREEATDKIIKAPNGQEYLTLSRIYQPSSENLFDVYEMIVEDLQKNLKPHGEYKIQPFGSAITGMSFKNSDIDFYIEAPINKKSKKQFSKVYNVLLPSEEFLETIAIWHARVPIIKTVHKKTGYPLDINTSSGHGVYNSEFLEKLIKSDIRFQPSLLIIRIWARYRDINKIGGMNSYCLMLMFFFYLQQLQIIPAFRSILAWADRVMFDDVNFGFNANALVPRKDESSVRELVEGFFSYYVDFDFEHRIICLYLGHAITWDFLKNENNFPEYHEQINLFNKKNPKDAPGVKLPLSTVVVQDPFLLFQNTAKSVNPPLTEKIQKHMELTNRIIHQSKNLSNQWWIIRVLYELYEAPYKNIDDKSSSSELNDNPVNSKVKTNKELQNKQIQQQLTKPQETAKTLTKTLSQKKFTFTLNPLEQELFYIRNYLRKEFPKQIFTLQDIHKKWAEEVIEYLKKMLKDIFALEVLVSQNFSKASKSDSQEDVHTDKLSFIAKISTDKDIWTSRIPTKKTSFGKTLKEQIDITKTISKGLKKDGVKPINLKAKIEFKVGSKSCVDVNIFDEVDSNSKTFFDFFSSYVRILLKGYLEINLVKDGKF